MRLPGIIKLPAANGAAVPRQTVHQVSALGRAFCLSLALDDLTHVEPYARFFEPKWSATLHINQYAGSPLDPTR